MTPSYFPLTFYEYIVTFLFLAFGFEMFVESKPIAFLDTSFESFKTLLEEPLRSFHPHIFGVADGLLQFFSHTVIVRGRTLPRFPVPSRSYHLHLR